MTASDAQLAELIEMEQKPAKRERRIPCVLKLHMQYRGRYPSDPEFVLPNWYRDFEVADKTTLEQLAGVILQILGWVEDHLYEFKINGRRNVNFGNDGDYIVDAIPAWQPPVEKPPVTVWATALRVCLTVVTHAYARCGMESLRIQALRAPFSPVATNKFHGRRMKRVLSAFERHIERLAVAVSERHVEAKVIFGQRPTGAK